MGFVMGGLESEAYDREYGDVVLVRRILSYFRPHLRAMLLVAVMVVARSGVDTAVPLIVSRGLDALTGQLPGGTILTLVGTVVALSCLSWVFNYFRQIHSARVVGDVVLKLREDAFAAVTRRDLSFYDDNPTGKIVSRVTSDTQDFADTIMLVMDVLSQLLLVGIITVVLFAINVRLALITIAVMPLVIITALSFRKVARRVTRRARRVLAKVNANTQESISGIAVAKSFRQESAVYEDFDALNKQAYKVNLARGLTLNTIFPLLTLTSGIGMAVVTYYGGLAAASRILSPGEWFLFVQSLNMFWFPLSSIASFWSQFQDGLSSSERVFALIDAEPRVVQDADEPVPELTGEIEFRHLRFSYTGDEVVLPDYSLTIKAGEKLALVGHTGAGKSSIARLIARFYEFQGGHILIDGRSIRKLNLAQYRRHLGIVPQEPFLFSGTLGENIRYGRPEASDEEVEEVAKRLGGGEWLSSLPKGLNTDVGERGAHLSMGQRQLAALARVMIQDPAILILDEATASVDPFTETHIQEGLDLVMRGRTSIVIAHRLSTVKNADRIVVMAKGRIIEEGNHDALMTSGGHYAELYDTYFRHQSLEYLELAGRLIDEG
ncbi:MAG: ABC transporter ATP-binding protein/permease [Anaerolineae bacterium]|nr:ABC transporter ATP-binding protein/permease [Anaerolineae bacterium]